MERQRTSNRVCITGTGTVLPGASNVNDFTAMLRAGQTVPFAAHDIPPLSQSVIMALMEPDNDPTTPNLLDEKSARLTRRLPPTRRSMLTAAIEAWRQAGLDGIPASADRSAVVCASQYTIGASMASAAHSFADNPDALSPSLALQWQNNHDAGLISELFGLRGPGFSVAAGSASSFGALIQAARLITSGEADICLVCAPAAELSPMEFMAYRNLGALHANPDISPAEACRPFDRDAAGFVPSQCAAAIILESADLADTRGATPLCFLAGWGQVMSGNSLPTPSAKVEARAMTQALHHAGIPPNEIDFINTHATSTPAGDMAEGEAMEAVFGKELGSIPINATKGLTGHGLGSAGLVETIAALVQMEGDFIHPNKNITSGIHIALNLPLQTTTGISLHRALNNGFAFGGTAMSIVLERD